MSQETISSQTDSVNHTPRAGTVDAFPNDALSSQRKQLQWGWKGAGGHSLTHEEIYTVGYMEAAVKSVRKRDEEGWRKLQRAVRYLDLILRCSLPEPGH